MIKNILRWMVPKKILSLNREIKNLSHRMDVVEDNLRNKWLLEKINEPLKGKDVLQLNGYKIYSQNNEDGMLNYIFSKIKPSNKSFVEIGVEDGRECNTANLSLNFGWKGILVDGDKSNVNKAKVYYNQFPVKVLHSFVNRENINKILSEISSEELDLFSLDIDGNDYWVWESLNVIRPKVVILEYNPTLGFRNIATKYDPKFERYSKHKSGLYFGASLSALTKLSREKGYILVGCCGGTNAFFVRKDLVKNKLSELSPEEAFMDNDGHQMKFGNRVKRFNLIKHLDFEEV